MLGGGAVMLLCFFLAHSPRLVFGDVVVVLYGST